MCDYMMLHAYSRQCGFTDFVNEIETRVPSFPTDSHNFGIAIASLLNRPQSSSPL